MSPRAILVVDDDRAIRSLVRRVLVRSGYEADEAESGNQAIARLRIKRYDAMVLDLMMRDGSGEDVLTTLETEPLVDCIVVMSAASTAKIAKVENLRVVAKLRKPFDIMELVDAVRQCFPSG
jgi:DNA-binding response OmpR family regulator